MAWHDHARTTGTALKNWFIAQCYDCAAVALLWLVGLLIIGIPWAPLWAFLAGLLPFFPHLGGAPAVITPALIRFFSPPHPMGLGYVLLLFVAVLVIQWLFLPAPFLKT